MPLTSSAALALAVELITPHGRCNRKGLLVIAVALLVVQGAVVALMAAAGIAHDSMPGLTLNLAFLWLATTAIAKRLHDLGASAWRIVWAFAALFVWIFALSLALALTLGFEAIQPGAPGYVAALVGCGAPVFGATLWLHFARGEEGPNRFGPAPGDSGFSERLRVAQAAS